MLAISGSTRTMLVAAFGEGVERLTHRPCIAVIDNDETVVDAIGRTRGELQAGGPAPYCCANAWQQAAARPWTCLVCQDHHPHTFGHQYREIDSKFASA